jgi:ABC-type long-subunit fatty acid transport system fused permease/ATPase subunit
VVKEAMTMRDGHLLKRAGREFANNFIWMAVVLGLLVAVLAAATDLSLVGMMAFVGVFAAVVAAIVTVVVIWSRAPDGTTRPGGHDYPSSPPDRGGRSGGGGWDDVGKWPG